MSDVPILRQIFRPLGIIAGVAVVGLCGAVAYGFLAPTKLNYTVNADWTERCVAPAEVPIPRDFLGLAFSGGGSRAAVFAAAGAAALEDAGILSRVTHISSVSGGGFAASYLATHPDPLCSPNMTGPTPQNCLRADMDQMRPAMTADYFWAMEWHQVSNPSRAFSPSRRVTSLQDALERSFLNDTTFADMPADPVFLFNGVSYDSGDRFVMSNAALADRGDAPGTLMAPDLRMLSFSEPGCARKTPGDMPLSLAVVTSAAFPPVLGPITIALPEKITNAPTQYWHLGDGGVIENTGLDTLLDAALIAAARNPEIEQVNLISFNAGLQVDTEKSRATHDLYIWQSEPGRLVDMPNLRADRLRDIYVDQIAAQSGLRINMIKFNYLDAQIPWQDACPQSKQTPLPDVRDYLATIPTDLVITACDAAMMEAAATALVTQALGPYGALTALGQD